MTQVEKLIPGEARFAPWRIALFVLLVSGFIWLGTIHIRAIIGGDLFRPGTIEFDDFLAPSAEREIFRLLSMTGIVTLLSYPLVLISSIVFLARSPLRLKDNGWLMMSAILLYLFVPVEVFTMTIDARMIYLEFFTTVDDSTFRELFLSRVQALAGAPFIALLCYYTILALTVFQPLKRHRTGVS